MAALNFQVLFLVENPLAAASASAWVTIGTGLSNDVFALS